LLLDHPAGGVPRAEGSSLLLRGGEERRRPGLEGAA
jgi:hypothetical protein